MRAPDPAFRAWFDAARAVPIESVIEERGIPLRGRIEREGACPECGGGRGANRFSINTRKQVFQCRKGCGSGSVIDLVMMLDRCDERTAAQTLTGRPPPSGTDAAMSAAALAEIAAEREAKRVKAEREAADFRERERRRLRGWWKAAKPAPGSAVEAYLALRRVSLPPGARLRFDPAMPVFASGAANAPAIGSGPAMLAGITGTDGRFAGVHITWLDLSAPDGKARVADADGVLVPAKKVRGSQLGGHIRLGGAVEPVRLFMGEGIETTLSVRDALIEAGALREGDAFWSGVNLGNIGGPHADTVPHPTLKSPAGRVQRVPGPDPAPGGIPIPQTVTEIVILGDGDSDPFTTRTAYARAAARWTRPGRTVRVAMAPEGADFNSLRRGRS